MQEYMGCFVLKVMHKMLPFVESIRLFATQISPLNICIWEAQMVGREVCLSVIRFSYGKHADMTTEVPLRWLIFMPAKVLKWRLFLSLFQISCYCFYPKVVFH